MTKNIYLNIYPNAYFKTAILILSLILFIWPVNHARAQTTEIFFSPISATAKPGELVQVSVFLQTAVSAPINALEADITVPESIEISSIKTADSAINFWVEPPRFDPVSRRVRFSGIIPGGFTGVLSPFRSERQPGKLFDLVLSSAGPEKTITELSWQNAQAWLNQANATPAELATSNLSLSFDPKASNSSPVTAPIVDTDPPERFRPEIARDENILDGRWFVVFATRDTGVGVRSYQVAEYTDASLGLGTSDLAKLEWREATSPYVLRDQTRASYVSVRALDLAGNSRIETLAPETDLAKAYTNYPFWLIIIALCLAALSYYFYSVYSRRR